MPVLCCYMPLNIKTYMILNNNVYIWPSHERVTASCLKIEKRRRWQRSQNKLELRKSFFNFFKARSRIIICVIRFMPNCIIHWLLTLVWIIVCSFLRALIWYQICMTSSVQLITETLFSFRWITCFCCKNLRPKTTGAIYITAHVNLITAEFW